MRMLDLVKLFAGRYMLTRNEVKQLAEIKCNDLYYYYNKCDRKHKLATKTAGHPLIMMAMVGGDYHD